MSVYNILTSESREYNSTTGWNLNIDNYYINTHDTLYPFNNEDQPTGKHRFSKLDPPLPTDRFSCNSAIDSSSLPNTSNNNNTVDPLTNLFDNFDISKAKIEKPFNN